MKIFENYSQFAIFYSLDVNCTGLNTNYFWISKGTGSQLRLMSRVPVSAKLTINIISLLKGKII